MTTHDKVSKEHIATLLRDHTAEWTERRDALLAIRGIVQAASKEQILSYITEIQPLICIQLDDRRSIYCKDVCELISFIAKSLQDMFEPLSSGFMTSLFQLLVVTIKVIAESAHTCILTILPHSSSSIPIISQGVKDKHPAMRARCTDYMCKIVESTPAEKLNNESYLVAIDEAIRSAIGDSNAEARALAKRSYQAFNKTFPERAQKLLASLESSLQKRLVETAAKPPARKGGFAEFLAKKQAPKPTFDAEIVVANDTVIVTSPKKHSDDKNDKDGSNFFSSSATTSSSSPSSTASTSTSAGSTTTSNTTASSPAATQSHSLAIASVEPIALELSPMESEPQPIAETPITEATSEPIAALFTELISELITEPIAETIAETISEAVISAPIPEPIVEVMEISQRPLTPMEVTVRPLTPMDVTPVPFEPVSPVAASPDITAAALPVKALVEELDTIEIASEVQEEVASKAVEAIEETTIAEVLDQLVSEVVEESVSEVEAPVQQETPSVSEEAKSSIAVEPETVAEAETPEVADKRMPVVLPEVVVEIEPISCLLKSSAPADATPEVDVAIVAAEIVQTTTESETALDMEPEQSVLSDTQSTTSDRPALSELLSDTEKAPSPLPSGKRTVAEKPLTSIKAQPATTKTTRATTAKTATTTTTVKQPLKPAVSTKPALRSTTTRASTPTVTTRSSTPTPTTSKSTTTTKSTATTTKATTTTKAAKSTTTTTTATTKREPLKALRTSTNEQPAAEPTKATKKVTRAAYSEDKENQINTTTTDAHAPAAKKLKVAPPPVTGDASIAARVKTRRLATATTTTTTTKPTTKTATATTTKAAPKTKTATSTSTTSKVSKPSSKRPTWV